MERVAGIGGFFFAARDPAALSDWYATNLGIPSPPMSYDAEVWTQESGPTVFAPFPADADPAAAPPHGPSGWGLNFRVTDLDAMVAQLRSASVAVEVDSASYPNGRFAQLEDPEGNLIQLWQPSE